MVRLHGPSPACSSRNRARLLAFRSKQDSGSCASTKHSDEGSQAKEVKEYWSTLTISQKIKCLRFEDCALAERLYEIQQSLYSSDMECFVHGFHSHEKVHSQAGSDLFDIEGVLDGNGSLCPRAFIAHRALVEMGDMFAFLEERLERRFLDDVSYPGEQHWSSLLKPEPSSWLDFVRVALKLVESAILKSWQESRAHQALALEGTQCVAEPLECAPPGLSKPKGQSARRKERKKRTIRAHAAASDEEPASNDKTPLVLPAAHTVEVCDQQAASSCSVGCLEAPAASSQDLEYYQITKCDGLSTISSADCQVMSEAFDGEPLFAESQYLTATAPDEGARISPVQIQNRSKRRACIRSPLLSPATSPAPPPFISNVDVYEEHNRSRTTSDSFDDMPVLAECQMLRHSAREARICAVVAPSLLASSASRASAREAWVQAEIQYGREGREERGRSRPWLLANGDSGENWVDGFRAVVKNSFLELEEVDPESCALRARSWPVCSWRHGGAYGGA